MAITPSPIPGMPSGSSRSSTGTGGRKARGISGESQPTGVPGWRRKWRPLSGRIPAERQGMLCWQRRFAGIPEQVGAARRFTQLLLADSAIAVDAAWVTGELASNAIRHARSGKDGGTFTVEVLRWRHHVQIQVIDAGGEGGPVLPGVDPATAISAGDPPESGLGLFGISALACRFGTYQYLDGSRVVWVRLKADPPRVVGVRR